MALHLSIGSLKTCSGLELGTEIRAGNRDANLVPTTSLANYLATVSPSLLFTTVSPADCRHCCDYITQPDIVVTTSQPALACLLRHQPGINIESKFEQLSRGDLKLPLAPQQLVSLLLIVKSCHSVNGSVNMW